MAQDYNKIFASGASSTQEWTDENYLKGWGYLGQTPPPYQLFDALFKRLDLKTQELNSNLNQMTKDYLPLIGGDMKGLVNLFASSTIPTPSEQDNSEKIVNTEWVQSFVKTFVNSLSNNLRVDWSGNYISVPALNITGLIEGNGYLNLGKLFGGIIFQWGSFYCEYTNKYFNFPISFTDKLFVITETHIVSVIGDFKSCSILNPDKDGFTLNSSDNGYVAHIIAIGK